jgi:diguanylate cyclase (GGDEF)-like protein
MYSNAFIFMTPAARLGANLGQLRHWFARTAACALFLLSLGALWPNAAWALDPVTLVEGTESYPLGLHLSYFEDRDGRQSLEEVRSGDVCHPFTPSQDAVPNFSFTSSSYWFQFDLSNESSPVKNWLLESQYPLLDRINVYLVYPDGRVVTYRGGDKLPFDKREVKHRNVMFNVPLAMGERVQVYVKVRTESSMQFPLVLRSPDALFAKDHEEQYILGIYYGILLSLLLYNLLVFTAIRDINYLYFVCYLGAWTLFQMSLNGLAFEYLWPNNPDWANKATPFFIGLTGAGLIQFARRLLDTKNTLPKFDTLLKYTIGLSVLIMVLALFAGYTMAIKVATAGALVVALLVISTGAWSLKNGFRIARYFMLAWTALMLGVILYVLKTFGILPTNIVTEHSMQIGSAVQVVLLSFALADRMRLIKEENARLQREATETLERRVQERTRDLDDTLLGLSEVNTKLQEMTRVDGLTGISNRGFFDEHFEVEWQRTARIHSHMGLLMLDIDHFKNFNDTYGHLGGDACLKAVAAVIQDAMRRPADRCFRYGGEEFVVLLPHTDRAGSRFIAERICKAVADMVFALEGRPIPVTVSVGVCSMIPNRDLPSKTLIGYADQALYLAKHNGRNRVETFTLPSTDGTAT